jgi:acetyl esterase/lipase
VPATRLARGAPTDGAHLEHDPLTRHRIANTTPRQPRRTLAAMRLLAALALVPLAACTSDTAAQQPSGPTFVERRAAHVTALTKRAPITDTWPTFATPDGAERVTFTSAGNDGDELELWGWYGAPPAGTPAPALLYLHGHFFMKPPDFERLRPLQARGFAIMTATQRGRNGNPGAHELLYGEVDDAVAAARWLADRPDVDPRRVYVFGHSMGGGVAALMALLPDAPVKMTGGCGAMYSTTTWKTWASGRDSDLVRFNPDDPEEGELRVLVPHADELVRPHWAFMGEREKTTQRNAAAAQALAQRAGRTLERVIVPGGHASAIGPALERWFDIIAEDAGLSAR